MVHHNNNYVSLEDHWCTIITISSLDAFSFPFFIISHLLYLIKESHYNSPFFSHHPTYLRLYACHNPILRPLAKSYYNNMLHHSTIHKDYYTNYNNSNS